jgi:hypothetical protein
MQHFDLLGWLRLLALGLGVTAVLAAASARSADPTCRAGAECRDGNPCTLDVCTAAGTCRNLMPPVSSPVISDDHLLTPGCRVCGTDGDCNDRNPCTTEACGPDGSCEISPITGCIRCFQAPGAPTPLSCHDGDPCTADTCEAGACVSRPADTCALCEPVMERCDDEADNDCDGRVDCADRDCQKLPRCSAREELCGNCIDDDDDRRVDYEDSDCCAAEIPLQLDRVMLRPAAAGPRHDRLRLASTYSPARLPDFDPMAQDTSLQIADEHGQLFCATVTADHWMPRGRRSVTFWDVEGRYAGGLADGRFTITRNGRIRFFANGRRMPLRMSDGRNVQVTLRVGNRCSRTTASLRGTATSLVFP